MLPEVGLISLVTNLAIVLLPLPDSPTRATISPGRTLKFTFLTTSISDFENNPEP